jgi:hypothetical protein
MADYISPEQWGTGTSLSYSPSSSWFLPNYQSMLPGAVPEGQAYSGMYLTPTSWLRPIYQNYATQYVQPTETQSDLEPIQFPTAEESAAWSYGQPGFQQMSNLLNMASTPEGFMASPYMQQAIQAIGRSRIPSSSYADRTITDAVMGQMLNTAGAWENYMNTVAPWAAGYAQYPLNVAGLLQG